MEHHTAEKTFPHSNKLAVRLVLSIGRTPTEDEESAHTATFFSSPFPHISGLVLSYVIKNSKHGEKSDVQKSSYYEMYPRSIPCKSHQTTDIARAIQGNISYLAR